MAEQKELPKYNGGFPTEKCPTRNEVKIGGCSFFECTLDRRFDAMGRFEGYGPCYFSGEDYRSCSAHNRDRIPADSAAEREVSNGRVRE